MKKPKKITIKHYLEKRTLKPVLIKNVEHWSVYISITVNRKTTNIKSSIVEKFKDFETLKKRFAKEIEIETKELEQKIRLKLSLDNDYTFIQPNRKKLIIYNDKITEQLENEILRLKRICKKQAVKISLLEQTNLF
jgi:outer membrane lipoprotein-sorting protein